MRAIQTVLLMTVLLAGCGFKGPLYLPQPCEAACTPSATQTTTQP